MVEYVLEYFDLGRFKDKGKVKIKAKNIVELNDKIYDEFSRHLVSSNIGFTRGNVFVGFGRPVGKYNLYKKIKGKLKKVI